MTQVKELYDSLSDEQKKIYGLGIWGSDDELRNETLIKILQWFSQHFPRDQLHFKVGEFSDLLGSYLEAHQARLTSGLKKDEETTAQIKAYFESLSDQQKLTLAEDLFGDDDEKRGKAMHSLLKFDGDPMVKLKCLNELIKNHFDMIRSLPYVQKQLKEKKDEGEKNEREHLAAERERINDVVRRHKELHPTQTRECPVCLEDIEMTEHNSMIYFYCCGQGTCRACCKKNNDSGGSFFSSCPFCRGNINLNNEEVTRAKNLKKLAENGSSFAQYKLALDSIRGIEEANIPEDEDGKKRIEWLQLASENNFPDLDAMVDLATECLSGTAAEKSKEKAEAWLKRAADMGSRRAQDRLAIYLYDKNGVTEDAIYYATLSMGERPTFIEYGTAIHSAFVLGCAFYCGEGGMKKNLYLARHYLKIAVQGNNTDRLRTGEYVQQGYERAFIPYGEALLILQNELYGDISVPGFSPIAKAMYWFHKAAALQCGCGNPKCGKEVSKRKGKGWIDTIKVQESKKCSYCSKKAEDCPGGKLKNCAKCSGAWYCSRDCQVAAWKAGHKRDCVSKDAPKEAALH